MNFSIIAYILGFVLKIESLLMLAPAMIGIIYGEKEYSAFLIFGIIGILLGGAISFKKPKNQMFYAKEGFVSVALSWIVVSIYGSLPFVINKDIPRFVDAFFEMVSGFTTTGASILADVESLSHASLFWRSFSHWIGGMGVLVFILSVLPITGGATMHLMKAESPGPQVGKVVPKMRDTAVILYVIYTVMTVFQMLILIIGKVPVFDAVTLAFGTAGTGGFSIKNSGVADYSSFAQYVIATFMILFGVNFNVYFLIIRKKLKSAFSLEELRWYLSIIGFAVLFVTLNTLTKFTSIEETFRAAYFQVASIITTTGFSTVDYNVIYPELSKAILVLLMFCGACAGSTGGGIKISRIAILFKSVRDEVLRIIHPRAVRKIRFENKVLDDSIVRSVYIFIAAYFMIFCSSFLIISLDNFDFTTNFTAVASAINNIGPGLNVVGPCGNFSGYSDLSKLALSFNMLAGRLEIFPMLVIFSPSTWKRSAKIHKHKKTA